MGDEAEELLKHRFAEINVWRPIRGPLLRSPLALCDAQTLSEENLVASDLRYPDRTGETYAVTFNPGQRWYYFPKMRADEAVLIRKEIEVVPETGPRPFPRAHRAVQRDDQCRVRRRPRGQIRDPGTRAAAMLQRAALDRARQLRPWRIGTPQGPERETCEHGRGRCNRPERNLQVSA